MKLSTCAIVASCVFGVAVNQTDSTVADDVLPLAAEKNTLVYNIMLYRSKGPCDVLDPGVRWERGQVGI